MRKDPDDFKPIKPFSLKTSVDGVYQGFKQFYRALTKIDPRKQVTVIAGAYAQMQLNNPSLLFPGAAAFIVTNIYKQMDGSRFFQYMPSPVHNQIVNGTAKVFKEIAPSHICLALAPRLGWPPFDVVKKILKQEEGTIEAYRHAGLDYAVINKPLLHAQMTLMNEQYNTLQPLLYGAIYQQAGYLFTSSLGIIKQEVVFSANPTERSLTLTNSPQSYNSHSSDFRSPEQRYNFGSKLLQMYFDLCRYDQDYVITELEKIRDRGREADPLLWRLYIEPVLPTRPREDVEKDFKKVFNIFFRDE